MYIYIRKYTHTHTYICVHVCLRVCVKGYQLKRFHHTYVTQYAPARRPSVFTPHGIEFVSNKNDYYDYCFFLHKLCSHTQTFPNICKLIAHLCACVHAGLSL